MVDNVMFYGSGGCGLGPQQHNARETAPADLRDRFPDGWPGLDRLVEQWAAELHDQYSEYVWDWSAVIRGVLCRFLDADGYHRPVDWGTFAGIHGNPHDDE